MQELTNQLVNKESFPTHPLPSQHSTSSFPAPPPTHPTPHPQIHEESPLSLKQPYRVRPGNPRLRSTQRKCKSPIHNLRPSTLNLTMTKSSRSRKSFKTSAYFIQIVTSIIKADPGTPSAAPEAMKEGAGKPKPSSLQAVTLARAAPGTTFIPQVSTWPASLGN